MTSVVRLRILVGTVLPIVALGVGCKKEEALEPATPPVRTIVLSADREAAFRRFPGEVSAVRNGRLSFDVGGRLIEFPVYDGMIAQPGQLLGRLDPTDFLAQFDSANATFVNAQAELQRSTTLFERRVIARNELDQRRQAFDVAEAALRTARKALEDTQLSAPFKGRVAHRFVRNFQNVQARELVLLLQDVTSLEVDINIPENAMALAGRNVSVAEARGLIEARAEFPAIPGKQFPLVLQSFATLANPASRTFPMSFSLTPPADTNILPGMTCTVFVRFREEADAPPPVASFLVPVNALATADGQAWVWKFDAATSTVSRISVTKSGPVDESMEVVSETLQPGDEIVVTGVRFLAEGMPVRRMEAGRP